MDSDLSLREVIEADLPIFFAHHADADARAMVAFTSRDPDDRVAFMAHWHRILANTTGSIRTIVVDGQVAGYVLRYQNDDHPEVSYWLGKDFWGRGLATRALAAFLAHEGSTRPIHARAAKDNIGSLRVLEKCGFSIVGEDRGFAKERGEEIEEYLLRLD